MANSNMYNILPKRLSALFKSGKHMKLNSKEKKEPKFKFHNTLHKS
jgi:hypothetical protein